MISSPGPISSSLSKRDQSGLSSLLLGCCCGLPETCWSSRDCDGKEEKEIENGRYEG